MNDLDIQFMHTRLKETGEDQIVFKNAKNRQAYIDFMKQYQNWQDVTLTGDFFRGYDAWQEVREKAGLLLEAIGRREVYAEDWA